MTCCLEGSCSCVASISFEISVSQSCSRVGEFDKAVALFFARIASDLYLIIIANIQFYTLPPNFVSNQSKRSTFLTTIEEIACHQSYERT